MTSRQNPWFSSACAVFEMALRILEHQPDLQGRRMTAFLLRHAIELCLKGILQQRTSKEEFTTRFLKKHSLVELAIACREYIECFDEATLETVKKLESADTQSIRYRYPIVEDSGKWSLLDPSEHELQWLRELNQTIFSQIIDDY